MQILQLSSYRASGIFAWIRRTGGDYLIRYFALAFFAFVSMFVYIMCFKKVGLGDLGYLFFVLLTVYFVYSVSREKQKTPLKFTMRIFRLTVVDFVLNCAVAFALLWLPRDTLLGYSLVGVSPLLLPLTLLLSHYIVLPIEKLIARSFIKKAKSKLNGAAPTVIAVTGSYGKTTAKNILAKMLSTRYKVFASPGSYNTPMGLCKCINEDYDGEQIFVAEFGARHKGDISELMKIFKPKYSILTAIGNQHLETFGSVENIITEKTAVLNVDFAVANGDSDLVRANAGKAHLCGKSGEVTYSNVTTSLLGTDFVLTDANGESVNIHTRLVGEHIPSAIAVCACMALKLGLSLSEIADSAKNLPFVEHRLEVLDSGDIKILDDSYNSNPSGAKNALDILATFDGNKVIITPGFVELGSDAEKCLTEFGAQIAAVCDYAFLLGNNAETIKRGMGEYPNATIVGSLDEAMDGLKELKKPMAVLFENDLPDNY